MLSKWWSNKLKSESLNDWLQVIGLFGVIASLVFVGLEVKQTREIALSNVYQARANASSEAAFSLAANEAAMTAFTVGRKEGVESLSSHQISAGIGAHIGLMFLWDNSHFQFERGFIPEDHWNRIRWEIKGAMRVPFRRSFTEARYEMMRPSFREMIIEILEELDEESGN
jgi:hypothetical protein